MTGDAARPPIRNHDRGDNSLVQAGTLKLHDFSPRGGALECALINLFSWRSEYARVTALSKRGRCFRFETALPLARRALQVRGALEPEGGLRRTELPCRAVDEIVGLAHERDRDRILERSQG